MRVIHRLVNWMDWSQIRDSLLLIGILTFSLPLKTPALQQMLESSTGISFPLNLSTYTILLPPMLGLTTIVHWRRIPEVWNQLRVPLLILACLFIWMWLGAWFSEWRAFSLKHAGRYSIHLVVFLTLLLLLRPIFAVNATRTFILWFATLTGWTAANAYFWTTEVWLRIPKVIQHWGLELELFRWQLGTTSGFFENPNPYALVAVIVLLLSCWVISQKCWLSGAIGVSSGLWGLYASGSRNGVLGFLIVLLILAVYGIQQLRNSSYHRLALVFPIVVIGMGLLLLVIVPNQATLRLQKKIFLLLEVKNYEQLETREDRFVFYRTALETGWNHNSLFGGGPKTAGYLMAKYSNDNWAQELDIIKETNNVHNAPLTLWLEMGWIGLLLSLAFLTEWFRRHKTASWLILGGGLVLCLGQIFDYFIWQITFMTVQSFAFVLMAATKVSSRQLNSE